MKKKLAIYLAVAGIIIGVFAAGALPFVASAAHNPIKSNVFLPTILAGPLLICTGTGSGGFPACQDLCDFVAQIENIIYFFIGVIIWIITPIMVTMGGIFIMLGGANPEMVGRGKKTITGAVWSVVIVLCAWIIISTFVHFLGITGIGGFGQASCTISS